MRKIISLTTAFVLAASAAQSDAHLPGRCQGLDPAKDGDADRAFECIAALETRLDEMMTLFAAADHGHTPEVPAGAVLAFDLSGGCPGGWSPFKPSQGRMLIGATFGTGNAPGLAENEAGDPLAEYKYRDHGGVERTSLELDNLPAHAHELKRNYTFNHASGPNAFFVDGRTGPVGDGESSIFTFLGEFRLANSAEARMTNETGNGRAHNNMPPYLALYFCKKD